MGCPNMQGLGGQRANGSRLSAEDGDGLGKFWESDVKEIGRHRVREQEKDPRCQVPRGGTFKIGGPYRPRILYPGRARDAPSLMV